MKKENGNVWWFFLIAIGFTWIFQLPRTLDSRGIIESPQLLLHLAGFLPQLGPFIAAFFLTYLSTGKDGVMKLLKRGWNALTSSLILGAFWGPWHFQQWFMGGAYRNTVPFLAFWYGILMQAILLTWLFNNTKTSLLPVILFHALMNAQVFPTWGTNQATMIFVSLWTIVTIVVVVVWGPRKLVRRKIE